MGRTHEPLIVDSDVLIEIVLVDVLEIMRADQIMVGHAGDGQHGRPVDLGVIQSVEQVDSAWSRGREAYPEAACELCISACCERSRLLVAAVNVTDAVFGLAKRLHQSVDSVAGKTEDSIDAPVPQYLEDVIGNCF